MWERHSTMVYSGRRAFRAALLFFVGTACCGCLRVPLPPVPFETNVVESTWLGSLPRPFQTDVRLGVIGLELPLPRLCDLGDAELLARAYMEREIENEIGELANNVDVQSVYIKEIRLTALHGDWSFMVESGFRLITKDRTITYWSNFEDRDERTTIVFQPDGDFDVFDLLPADDECVAVSLLYTGTYPAEPVEFAVDLTIEVQADLVL